MSTSKGHLAHVTESSRLDSVFLISTILPDVINRLAKATSNWTIFHAQQHSHGPAVRAFGQPLVSIYNNLDDFTFSFSFDAWNCFRFPLNLGFNRGRGGSYTTLRIIDSAQMISTILSLWPVLQDGLLFRSFFLSRYQGCHHVNFYSTLSLTESCL